MLLISFSLRNRAQLPKGWAPRVLVQCGVPYAEIWDVLHDMYESHVRSLILAVHGKLLRWYTRFHPSTIKPAFRRYLQTLLFCSVIG